MIEDTSKRDPMLHLIGSGFASGTDTSSKYITDMEADGQRQLVASTQLPIKGSDDLAAFGFKLGDPTDDLFRHAELPAGWTKQATDHAMWSRIYDDLGRERVAIFYKAAFYDRKAFCRAVTVESYVYTVADGRAPLLLDESWATRKAVRAAAADLAECEEQEAAEWDARMPSAGPDASRYAEWRDEHRTRAAAALRIINEIGE